MLRPFAARKESKHWLNARGRRRITPCQTREAPSCCQGTRPPVRFSLILCQTALINVRLTGRLLLFKTISTQHYETRSNFQVFPGDLSLSDANDLLLSAFLRVRAP